MADSPLREDGIASEGEQKGGVRERLPWKRRLLGEARVCREGGSEGKAAVLLIIIITLSAPN